MKLKQFSRTREAMLDIVEMLEEAIKRVNDLPICAPQKLVLSILTTSHYCIDTLVDSDNWD